MITTDKLKLIKEKLDENKKLEYIQQNDTELLKYKPFSICILATVIFTKNYGPAIFLN